MLPGETPEQSAEEPRSRELQEVANTLLEKEIGARPPSAKLLSKNTVNETDVKIDASADGEKVEVEIDDGGATPAPASTSA